MSGRLERWWYPERPPGALRALVLLPLLVPELLFRAGVAMREALYRVGVLRPTRIEGAAVISVGNLTVGGAGKTPVVIALAERLLAEGRRVAVVSRGYGRRSDAVQRFDGSTPLDALAVGDEPLLIARRCPGVSVWVGPDKASLARRARDESQAEVILVDDGFQTRRLARDLDLVVVDAAAGFGNGHLLPRGPLREPVSALARADLLWVKGTGPFDPGGRPHVRALHRPGGWVRPDGAAAPLESLRGRAAIAFCGIARPAGFFSALEALGVELRARHAFGDHHPFTSKELAALRDEAEAAGAVLVTTEKDHVRLPAGWAAWSLRLTVDVAEGEERLAGLLAPLLGRAARAL